MAIYRERYGIGVRLDSRTITVSAHPSVSAHRLAAIARSENGGEPLRLQSAWQDIDGTVNRRYYRVQMIPV